MLQRKKKKRYPVLTDSVTGSQTWNRVRALKYYSKVEILKIIEPGDLEKLTAETQWINTYSVYRNPNAWQINESHTVYCTVKILQHWFVSEVQRFAERMVRPFSCFWQHMHTHNQCIHTCSLSFCCCCPHSTWLTGMTHPPPLPHYTYISLYYLYG